MQDRHAWRLGALAAVLVAAAGGAGLLAMRARLPTIDQTAAGLRIGGAVVPEGADVRAFATERAREILERPITLRLAGADVLTTTPGELGATVDVDAIARYAGRVAHEGGLRERLRDAEGAREGQIDVPVRVSLPIEGLAARLAALKDAEDTPARAAKLDVATRTVTPHELGRYVDDYATAFALDRAIAAREDAVEIASLEVAPRASTELVGAIDVSEVVSRFETRYGYRGGQENRAQNVARAAAGMNGVVLMPGEVVSFNANVGPRSEENGFAPAQEIYKGELREGVGGGTCQAASTLHAAAYLGGIDVVERSHHSRPSAYIRMGLDATVAYPVVDLKLRNPYDFPIVLSASASEGAVSFELRGARRPAKVDFATETVGVEHYRRKIELASWLKEGQTHMKQHGIRGYSIQRTRVVEVPGGSRQVEVTTDVYPATPEIYEVPPGTDVEEALPPLPESEDDGRRAANEAAQAAN